jgi:4-amino-4-deoxy-L-arabinose transferase-like glycosyltransferase
MKPLNREILFNQKILIISLFLLALIVRLVALKQNYVIAHDGTLYIKMAKLFAAGQYQHEIFSARAYYAFFPLLIFAFYKVLGDWFLAGQLISVCFGSLTIIPLYLLARRLFDEQIALIGAVFYSICPQLVIYSAEVLRDVPCLFFYTTALWLGYKGIKDNKIAFMGLAGVFIAISTSLRIEGLALLAVFALFMLWYGIKGVVPWRRILAVSGAVLIIAMCVIIFFGFWFKQRGVAIGSAQILRAKYVVSSLGHKTVKDIEAEVAESDLSGKAQNFFNLATKHRFILYASQILYNMIWVFTVPLFLLFLFGLCKRRKVAYHLDEFLLVALYVSFVSVFFIRLNLSDYLGARLVFQLVVPALIWSGVGFVELKERIIRWISARGFPLRDRVIRYVTPFLLVIICIPLLAMAWAPQRKDKLELKEIGCWLKDHGYAHSIIMAPREFIRLTFYADGEFIDIAEGSYEDIMIFADEMNADLLVINRNTIDNISPDFLEKISPRELRRIVIPDIPTPRYATAVFLIKGTGER